MRPSGTSDAICPPIRGTRYLLAVGVILLAALSLRAYNLLALPIFTDEATYLRWAADIHDQKTLMSLFIPVAEDGKQPLFIWLSTAALAVFGDPLLAGRIVSVIAGLLSVLGILLAGRWLEDELTGLLAAALYVVVPYTLVFDRMALADSWISMTAIWAFALAVFITKRARDSRAAFLSAIALGLVLSVGIWVKSTAIFVVAFPWLALFLLPRCFSPSRRSILSIVIACGVFVACASLLFFMPYAETQLKLLTTHVRSPGSVGGSLPIDFWLSGVGTYLTWVEAYLPSPFDWVVVVSVVSGLVLRRQQTLLLLGCWLVVVVPATLMTNYFVSRYYLHSVFPMLLIVALLARDVGKWTARLWKTELGGLQHSSLAALTSLAVVVLVSLSSLAFDRQLLDDPSLANWAPDDRHDYIEAWSAGYGFDEALKLALAKANEYGTDVFILSDHFQGLSHDGLALYVRGIPKIHHFVDARIAWGEPGLADAWRSHNVPLIIFRNDGRFRPEAFEGRVPEAKLLGTFWKPGGRNSFRVYELDPRRDVSAR